MLVTGQGCKGISPAVELKLPRKTKQENNNNKKPKPQTYRETFLLFGWYVFVVACVPVSFL